MVNYEYITSMYQIYNPTKYANENRLKIVTYNVHSFGNEITGFSAKEFAEMMNKEETDVLCFQEYRGNGDFTEQDLQNTYAKTFPYSFIPRIESGHLQPLPHQTVTNNRISEYQ